MKSFIFCTSYMRSAEDRLQRYQKWVDYYKALPFCSNKPLFLIDDGSKEEYLSGLGDHRVNEGDETWPVVPGEATVYHFKERRGMNPEDNTPGLYGSTLGWYRSFFSSSKIASTFEFDKIIHIESDAYLLTQRICDYIDSLTSGWTSFYCPKYSFPETSIQVICKDQFDNLRKLANAPLEMFKDKQAENVIPFTLVERGFVGDRYGEATSMQLPGIDYYNQCNLQTKLKFRN